MYVHYILNWVADPNTSQFVSELSKYGANFRVFSNYTSFNYKWRLRLYFIAWPNLIFSTIYQGLRSFFSEPKPDIIVVNSHIELAIFGLLRKIFKRDKLKLVLMMFIYTSNVSTLKKNLKFWYFYHVLPQASVIVCYSKIETEQYKNLFKLQQTKFIYIPYALNVNDTIGYLTPPNQPYILSAGRSGRDYELLIKVFKDLNYCLHIICDSAYDFSEITPSKNILILRNCYGECYLRELKNSTCVVIPLKVQDISAGQMVMLQAMFYSKPIIITSTTTTVEYLKHNETGWFVEQGDAQSLRMAIEYLMSDNQAARRLGENGRRLYENNHSMPIYVKNIQKILNELWENNNH